MKPPFLLLFFCSSLLALAVAPLNLELAIAPFVLTGLLVMIEADYGRPIRQLTAPQRSRKTPERLRLAA